MKLSDATLDLTSSRFFTICEEGEAPKWGFRYDNWHNDPRPSILLLGAYTHPSTGNNLVGGINLNYLNDQERDNLARVLPQIMKTGNLYSRYHTGRRLLPQIFDTKYRTYDSKYIRGVDQSVFYPKYGFMKTAKDWFKKKLTGMFKTSAQRQKEAEPQFPSDLSGMKDQLDHTVQQLQATARQREEPPETPEMQAARQAFFQYQAQRQRGMQDVERQEDLPFLQASHNFNQQQALQGQAPASVPTPSPQEVQPPAPTLQDIGQNFEKERLENQAELMDPRNELDLDDPELKGYFDDLDQLGESITYYSPRLGRYIIESYATALNS